MKELQELRNEILMLRNYGVINKEEEKSLLTKLNSVKEELRLSRFSKQSELLKALYKKHDEETGYISMNLETAEGYLKSLL